MSIYGTVCSVATHRQRTQAEEQADDAVTAPEGESRGN